MCRLVIRFSKKWPSQDQDIVQEGSFPVIVHIALQLKTFSHIFPRIIGSAVLRSPDWLVENKPVEAEKAGYCICPLFPSPKTVVPPGEVFYSALWDEGVIVVAAAGNNGDDSYKYPASYSNVLSVAAVDKDLKRARFSVRNDKIDLSAPGTYSQQLL